MSRILAVTHDSEIMKLCTRHLKAMSHFVVASSEVAPALTWLNKTDQLPDLIMVDVGLRRFQGREFIEKIRTSTRLKEIPLVIQTQNAECGVQHAYEGMLIKPFSGRDLTGLVTLLLGSCFKTKEVLTATEELMDLRQVKHEARLKRLEIVDSLKSSIEKVETDPIV